jgi:hypothetical protein
MGGAGRAQGGRRRGAGRAQGRRRGGAGGVAGGSQGGGRLTHLEAVGPQHQARGVRHLQHAVRAVGAHHHLSSAGRRTQGSRFGSKGFRI